MLPEEAGIEHAMLEYNKDEGDQPDGHGNLLQERTLPDGSRHRVIKNWLREQELRALLEPHADQIELREFEQDWFVKYRLQGSAG